MFQAAFEIDHDRNLEPYWTKAIESVEAGVRIKMIEVFVNANKKDIVDDDTKRWDHVKNTDHVKDPENVFPPYFALQMYLEHSCEQEKNKLHIETTTRTASVIDMAR